MARTTHHTPADQRLPARDGAPIPAWRDTIAPCGPRLADEPAGADASLTWHVTHDLRYRAPAAHGKPVPEPVVRRTVSYSYAGAFGGREVDQACAVLEGAARAATRDRLRGARAAANALLRARDGAGELGWDDDCFDVAPTRHRRSAEYAAF